MTERRNSRDSFRAHAEALLLDRSLRFSPQESALEQGWLLSEMEERFGYRWRS